LKAIDTNVALRLIVGDDEAQTKIAVRLLDDDVALVTLSVAMETEWVLRAGYRWERVRIADALTAFAALENIEFQNWPGVRWAIERMRGGADFADMIHLISAVDAECLATFDRRLAKRAGAAPPRPIMTLT